MNLDVVVLLWGLLVIFLVVAGIVTGEWKEKFYYIRTGRKDNAG